MDPDFDDDRGLRDAHRAATDARDERPARRVRETVLAEAARVARTRGTGRFGGRYRPQSLAAVLIVSVMAGLVVTHVLRDESTRLGTVAGGSVDEAADATKPSPPANVSIATRPIEPDKPSIAKTAPPPAAARAARTATASPAVGRTTRVPLPDVDRSRAPAAADGGNAGAARSMAAPPPALPAVAPASAPLPATDRVEAPLAAAPPARMTVMPPERADLQRQRADLRMLRILALRRAGNDDEADRELARWRADYPDVAPPPDAYRPIAPR